MKVQIIELNLVFSLTRHVCLGYSRDSSAHQRVVMSLGDIAGISGMLRDITQEVSEIRDVSAVSYFRAFQGWIQTCAILGRFKGARVLRKHQGWKNTGCWCWSQCVSI